CHEVERSARARIEAERPYRQRGEQWMGDGETGEVECGGVAEGVVAVGQIEAPVHLRIARVENEHGIELRKFEAGHSQLEPSLATLGLDPAGGVPQLRGGAAIT